MFCIKYLKTDIIGGESIVLTKDKVIWNIDTQSVASNPMTDVIRNTAVNSDDPRVINPMITKYERWKQFFHHSARTLEENKNNLRYNKITGHETLEIQDGDFSFIFDLTCTDCPSYCMDLVNEIKRILRNFLECMAE